MIRALLYRLASILGDVNALAKGKPLQRMIRKRTTRGVMGLVSRIFTR